MFCTITGQCSGGLKPIVYEMVGLTVEYSMHWDLFSNTLDQQLERWPEGVLSYRTFLFFSGKWSINWKVCVSV